jgi:antitoxin HigA-1
MIKGFRDKRTAASSIITDALLRDNADGTGENMRPYPRTYDGLAPVHPGEFLRDELDALDLSAEAFAGKLGIRARQVSDILEGRCGITAEMALRLARFFGAGGVGAESGLDLQKTYEFKWAKVEHGAEIACAVTPLHVA